MMENCLSSNLPAYGPALLIKRPVRTRIQGIVGVGGIKTPGYSHNPKHTTIRDQYFLI
jgi:hypothetical protein